MCVAVPRRFTSSGWNQFVKDEMNLAPDGNPDVGLFNVAWQAAGQPTPRMV
jgi:hypothetical protein